MQMRLRIENRLPTLLMFALPVGAASILLAACGSAGEASPDETNGSAPAQVRVVTSLPLLADFARQIGAARVEVAALLPSGADPHTFQLTPRNVQRITEAEVVIVNGLGLETPTLRLIEANLRSDATLLQLAEEAAAAGADSLGNNPHLWLDVANARLYAHLIRDALAEVDPSGAQEYEANYRGFLEELDDLDRYVQAQIAGVLPERRKLVTTHDAFPYLARYLDFEVVAVVAPSPNQEPSPQDIAKLGRAISQESVAAVFAEPQLGSQGEMLTQAAADAGVTVCTLYSDSLDDEVKSYIEMMRFNAHEIARCLEGRDG